MILGPIATCVHFIRIGHKLGAAAPAILYGAALISCARDQRRQELSNGSLAIIILWLGLTAWIWISLQSTNRRFGALDLELLSIPH